MPKTKTAEPKRIVSVTTMGEHNISQMTAMGKIQNAMTGLVQSVKWLAEAQEETNAQVESQGAIIHHVENRVSKLENQLETVHIAVTKDDSRVADITSLKQSCETLPNCEDFETRFKRFDRIMNETLSELEQDCDKTYNAMKNSGFYKLEHVREYVHRVNPYVPFIGREKGNMTSVDYYLSDKCPQIPLETRLNRARYCLFASKEGYATRSVIKDKFVTRGCLIFLKNYYEEEFHDKLRALWPKGSRKQDRVHIGDLVDFIVDTGEVSIADWN